MDLRTDEPYWLLRNGLINTYPSLQDDTKADVAIMGAGITGALAAWYLSQAGFSVVVTDRRHVGMGSTSASTALLQYEIDTPLRKLKDMVGEKNASRSYDLCRQSIYNIQEIVGQLGDGCEFELRPSMQFASYKKDVKTLREEYSLRKKHGFDIDWLTAADVKDKFNFEAHAAVLSSDGAQVNAYRLTHNLLKAAAEKGAHIFDNTNVEGIIHQKNGVLLKAGGKKIHAKKLVIACGYESQRYIPKQVQQLYSTYAIISEPLSQQHFWYKNALIWETAMPYLYLRTTCDRRILIGGLDDDFSDPKKRERRLAGKARLLHQKFGKLFPEIPFKTDFTWAGTFAGTKDGLPYIGGIPGRPHTYFALGFGGNGITFSAIAAEIITGLMQGKKNKDAAIFSFER